MVRPVRNSNLNQTRQTAKKDSTNYLQLYKMNPENNDTMFVAEVEPDSGGTPVG